MKSSSQRIWSQNREGNQLLRQQMISPANRPQLSQPSYRWLILALLMALCFISHFNRASMASAGDERLMKQFNITPGAMGWVYSAFLMVYTLFMVPGGLFIDRFGPRAALMLMGFGTAIFCAITGAVR